MDDNAIKRTNIRASDLTLTAGVLIGDTAVWAAFLGASLSWTEALALHLALAGAPLAFVIRKARKDTDRTWPSLLSTATAFAGPVGAAGTLVAILQTALYARTARPFDEWYASMFPEPEFDPEAIVVERVRASGGDWSPGSSVTPFMDLMAFGSLDQKQDLLTLLANDFRPEFAPALRMGLEDTEAAVRVQAASAVTRIVEDFLVRRHALEEQLAGKRAPGVLRDLARHCDAYHRTGILDPGLSEESRLTALRLFEEYLQDFPDDSEALTATARILLNEGRIEEARDRLERGLTRGAMSTDLKFLYMETLFELGRLEELRAFSRGCAADFNMDHFTPEAEVVRAWSDHPGAVKP